MSHLDGKVVLITGAAQGQGAAEARQVVASGGSVLVTDVLDDLGAELVADLGSNASYARLDVTDESDWAEAVDALVRWRGRIDVLVNNAGIALAKPFTDTTVDDYRRIVEVNQLGPFLGMRAVVPTMIGQRSGSIVNISSIDGLTGTAGFSAYASTKHAMVGLTKSTALELGPLGIRVNSVHPGAVRTPMIDDPDLGGITAVEAMVVPQIPLRRLGAAEDVAQLVCFLASDESSYCTGASFLIDGGWIAGITLG